MPAKKKFIKVQPLAFHLAMEALKKSEMKSKSLVLKDMPISRFLIRASDYESSLSSIPIEVKMAIMTTYGISHPDPSRLSDDKEMADFNFNSAQYLSLTRKFNRIATSHNSSARTISASSVTNCDTVKDCIDLVTSAAQ